MPKIIRPEPYWSGPFSEWLIIGLIISGILLAVVSMVVLRAVGQRERRRQD